MSEPVCLFCTLPHDRIVSSNMHGVFIRDGLPVSNGHTLIIPRRHLGSYFDLKSDELNALLLLLEQAKQCLDKELQPDGYNIGINDGLAAGQTISHLHIHLIPRYRGDREDPRGGVRWMLPGKAQCWP